MKNENLFSFCLIVTNNNFRIIYYKYIYINNNIISKIIKEKEKKEKTSIKQLPLYKLCFRFFSITLIYIFYLS